MLYRFFAADDRLLYVGITCNPGKRLERHSGEKTWWAEVVRVEMEQHPSREALRSAERLAIGEELPLYNVRMNGGNDVLARDAVKLRRGLELNGVYALGLDDGTCPCGLLIKADEEGVLVAKFSWIIGVFDREEWVPYDAIRRWMRAEEVPKPANGQPWSDGFYRPESTKVVFDMDPLGDFQNAWHRRIDPTPPDPDV